jgi:hypothetical protein
MAYFAKVENGIVTSTLEAIPEDLAAGFFGDPSLFVGYNEASKRPAVFGGTYRADINEFIDPAPYPSWVLDSNNDWQPPTPKPNDGKLYEWSESVLAWIEIISPV